MENNNQEEFGRVSIDSKPNDIEKKELNQEQLSTKILSIKDLVDIIQGYNYGVYNDDDLKNLGQSISVRNYIPLEEKIQLVSTIMVMHKFAPNDGNELIVGKLYMYIFFYIMLGAYAFIDCSDVEQINYANYDILYPVFYEFIKKYAGDDLDYFDKFVHDCINMYYIQDMATFYNQLDPKELAKASELNNQMLKTLEENKGYIKDLKDLTEYNGGDGIEAMKNIREQARKKVMYGNTDVEK